MKSKVNPRLLIVRGIAVVVLVGFGAVTILGGGDDTPAESESSATSDSQGGADQATQEAAEEADDEAEPPVEGTPVVADEAEGRSDWAVGANAICGRSIDELLAQNSAPTPEAATEALDDARRVVDELGALVPEPGTEADVSEFVALLRSAIDAAGELVAAGEDAELEDLAAFIEEQAVAQARLQELATSLGADVCVAGAAPSGDDALALGTDIDIEEGACGLLELQEALQDNDSVVLVVYSPDAELDTRVVREARAGANGGGGGFVAVNGTREGQIRLLAEAFELRETPTTLVINPGLVVSSRFSGFADRETVAQAVRDSLGAS